MGDDADGTPTRRMARRKSTTRRPIVTDESKSTQYSFTRRASAPPDATAISVLPSAHGVEVIVNGQSLKLTRSEARRVLASLLELFG